MIFFLDALEELEEEEEQSLNEMEKQQTEFISLIKQTARMEIELEEMQEVKNKKLLVRKAKFKH